GKGRRRGRSRLLVLENPPRPLCHFQEAAHGRGPGPRLWRFPSRGVLGTYFAIPSPFPEWRRELTQPFLALQRSSSSPTSSSGSLPERTLMSDPNPNVTGNPPPPDRPAPQTPATPPAPGASPSAAPPRPPAAPPKAPPRRAPKRGASGRGFLTWFAAGMGSMTAALGLMTLGTLRFLFPNVLAEPPSKVKVGLPENFEEGKVTDKFK